MVFDLHSPSFSSDSDTESGGKICPFPRRAELAGPFSSGSTDSDTKSGRTELRAVLLMDLSSGQTQRKVLKVLSGFSGVRSISWDTKIGRCVLVGFSFDPLCVASALRRKIGNTCIVSVDSVTTPRKNTFPTAGANQEWREGGKKVVMKLDVDSDRPIAKALRLLGVLPGPPPTTKALRILGGFPGVMYVALCHQDTLEVVGSGIDVVQMLVALREICNAEIVSVADVTEPNHTFPTSVRITELQPNEDTTDLERKTSPGMLISGERKEQSEKQQEGQLPPGQDDCYVSQGTSDQKQATPDHLSELSFPSAASSSSSFWTKSQADVRALSRFSGDACLPKAMKLMEENGLQGHDHLCETAVHHPLSGIHGNGEIKKRYQLLEGVDDSAAMLRKQAEELEPKVSMANVTERRLLDMLHISEESHDKTKRELALMREKLNEANSRIEYLEAAVSRYQNRIVVAETEKEKAEERASRAGWRQG